MIVPTYSLKASHSPKTFFSLHSEVIPGKRLSSTPKDNISQISLHLPGSRWLNIGPQNCGKSVVHSFRSDSKISKAFSLSLFIIWILIPRVTLGTLKLRSFFSLGSLNDSTEWTFFQRKLSLPLHEGNINFSYDGPLSSSIYLLYQLVFLYKIRHCVINTHT